MNGTRPDTGLELVFTPYPLGSRSRNNSRKGPERKHIDEMPDHIFQIGMSAACDGLTDDKIFIAGDPVKCDAGNTQEKVQQELQRTGRQTEEMQHLLQEKVRLKRALMDPAMAESILPAAPF